MVSLKYAKEYRMDVDDSTGKKKTVMIYVGPYFDYNSNLKEHATQRIILCGLGLLSLALFILGISFYSNLSKAWYTAVPYAANALLLLFYFESVFFFWPYEKGLKRENKEKGGERFKPICLSSLIFYLLSLVGSSVKLMALETTDAFDWLFFGSTIAEIILMIFTFVYARKIKYTERENPVAKDWTDK